MPKRKRLQVGTSYNEVLDRFVKGELLRTDYSFIGSIFRQFKDDIAYVLLKARIDADIKIILRTPKQSSESAKDMGHLEGLDACLKIIDALAKYDEQMPKDVETQEEVTLDQMPVLQNQSASIDNVY